MLTLQCLEAGAQQNQPIALLPENPHYYLFRGKPTILVTSGEHYGSVLNVDVDYVKYLDTLAADGMNLTRTFSGVYCEPPGAFNITRNTLAPVVGKYLAPWTRSGEKFDLSKFDDAYFKRLKDFVAQAGRRGIVVELVLFCTMYDDSQWKLSPMNAANNVNSVGKVRNTEVYTMDKSGGLLPFQEALVRKISTELKDFDNVYYEVCNEPYFAGVTLDWQHHMADVLFEVEKVLKVPHLIAQNIANGRGKVDNVYLSISILNYHYAEPESVSQNYTLDHPINDDETGFRGTFDATYATEAWNFFMTGGAGYSGLDYSFVAGFEDGTFPYPITQPGAGGPGLRRQLRILKSFFETCEFWKLRPDTGVKGAQALVESGKQYLFHRTQDAVAFDLPAGSYQVRWLDVHSGEFIKTDLINHLGGIAKLDFGGAQVIQVLEKGRPAPALAVAPTPPRSNAQGQIFVCDDVTKAVAIQSDDGKQSRVSRVAPTGGAKSGEQGAMMLSGGAFLADLGSCQALLHQCRESGQFTIEAVVAPANLEQPSPASLVTFSTEGRGPNFSLSQDKDQLMLELRTSTNPKGAHAALCKVTDKPQHLVVTYKSGELIAYLDGKQAAVDTMAGDLKNWEPARLVFGNNYAMKAKWNGTIRNVAIYGKSLTAEEAASRSKPR